MVTAIVCINVKHDQIHEIAQKLIDMKEITEVYSVSGEYDLVVLDEVNVAVAWKLLELDEVLRLLGDKPPKVELVLTGRGADKEIVRMADLVTEMLNIKHPYEEGTAARRGIEY